MSTTAALGLRKPPRFVIDDKGHKVEAILDIETFQELMSILEDLNDNRLIDETLGEETLPWEEVQESLRREGKL